MKSILADGGYGGDAFALAISRKAGLNATVQIARRNELRTFKVMPKRWVEECSFAWLDKCRRLWKNCERRLRASLQFVILAFLKLLLLIL